VEGSKRHLKKLKIELPYDPAIPFLVIYIQMNISQDTIKTPAHPHLLQHDSQKPRCGNSSDALQLINELIKYDKYNGILLSHKQE
jgi:hypothetical protein